MLNMLGSLAGGLGLFMLGMWLMSDGLKQLAGNRLSHILQNWTSSRLRGLSTGFLLTAIIQHSGAVTLATIGFANAGIITLRRAMWIIFGSNVGTAVTGWLVILIGFNFKIESQQPNGTNQNSALGRKGSLDRSSQQLEENIRGSLIGLY